MPWHEALRPARSYPGGMPDLSPRSLLDRVTLWARGHVLAVDALWAVVWFAMSMATWPRASFDTAESWVYLVLATACCAALALRRVRPFACLAVLGVLLAFHILWFDQPTAPVGICALVASYTAQAELPRPWRAVGLLLLLAGAAWAVLSIPPENLSADLELRLNSVVSAWTAVALFSLLGAFRRRNREEFARVVEHARLLETQREQEVRLAALDERTRIAREMHDILAHSLNVIVAQADGGRYAAKAAPERAVAALATVAQVGRESAAELHQLLGVLRDGEERGAAPAPGVGDLPGLVEEYRRAGLRIRLVQHGSPAAPRGGRADTGAPATLPATASLTVYRVVQESLANALKHGGPAAARVELTWSPGRVGIDVANSVREAAPAALTTPAGPSGRSESTGPSASGGPSAPPVFAGPSMPTALSAPEGVPPTGRSGPSTPADASGPSAPAGSCGTGRPSGTGRHSAAKAPSAVGAVPGGARRGPGHGLVGMRERVGLHGGTLEVGADDATGTWRVRAVVPWEEA
ncbi:Nitrate/nitrite sensor protein narX [Nocardiopsis dassonvillei]|uniref:histidine kinase n=2 Tax=Nocardiopsis dassonvillei TaxID=2014 RepID=D7B7L0_NOCDD|nr:integral membrane sensor signal transduction histidine kinase [Nocardiopsis dassonvillei subsp. dassonvillei DSM 43111]VEI89915.1 Nitrate/nitrite sensor protein narX [Nocardiopsis dassonvillei]